MERVVRYINEITSKLGVMITRLDAYFVNRGISVKGQERARILYVQTVRFTNIRSQVENCYTEYFNLVMSEVRIAEPHIRRLNMGSFAAKYPSWKGLQVKAGARGKEPNDTMDEDQLV